MNYPAARYGAYRVREIKNEKIKRSGFYIRTLNLIENYQG
jgi:hypothetical protein